MKYTNIMRNLSVAFIFLFCGATAFAQQTTANSPYSSFGLGELGGNDHAVLSGIGNTTITMQDSTLLNFYNPASYNTLAKGQPLFSIGTSTRLSSYSENGIKSFQSTTALQHFAMAFPFARNFGLAFGLKPYSRKGYEFATRIKVNTDSLYYNYSGTGGINEVFLGFSANVINRNGTRISLGGNAGYHFGSVLNTRKAGLISDAYEGTTDYPGGVGVKGFRVKSFHYEFGLQYDQRLGEKHKIGISIVVDPLQKIHGTYEDALYSATNINNPNSYADLFINDSLDGHITNVPTYTFGLSYHLNVQTRKTHVTPLNTEVSFHMSYAMMDWSKFDNTFDPTFTNNFLTSTKYTFGIQYVPETQFIVKKASTKFYHRMRYRIGTYYQTLPYVTNGEQVTDFGTTFGLGFPVMIQNSLSSINLGLSYGNRGISDSEALKETYYGIQIGITIAPNPKTDRWFKKRKLN
ncbi:MAG: hypothetical protein QNK23_14240 [Crocinitomicaceae bacterium]|nr:hypothetical protein [Crocinitomicaceae bacterium]